ncbi:bifunctional diaminohydroxyphosphoribosylaminopyrimidine deaminase/5-amino-6-(5-phosphoribosylamino)uracil reductase RibD [Aquipuribacter hungaricus]|uniref:Riboflavin biosynthesis protein RibD n=2 Tax=Aquipuribacter hungaricus TaxID=545624 RepID=A0ABV7WES6_9MICO
MGRALELAARGPSRGANPRVGCVLLAPDGRVLGEGHHRGAGTAHAEVDALADAARAGTAAEELRGATAVVTLEPCSHTGRTPPCTAALLAAGVARVVVGAADPNPVAAGGTDVLRAAGVDVVTGVLAGRSSSLNRTWEHAVRHGRPFVTLKWASTLDGRVAAADGSSRWLTGTGARADVHARRATADAVLVGTGTALVDDPWLTTRSTGADGTVHLAADQPLRVVLGERDLPADARLRDDAAPTLQLRTRDVTAALADLARREVRHVWVEGGPTVAAAFLHAGAVDELVTYLAPAVLGAGAPAVGDLGITSVAGTLRFRLTDVTRLGGDVVLTSTPEKEPV